ncbi:ABC transporter ATP-binding protein [Draconibacterium sp. IB214405]|uniref:ABC transporter ATP-binding protein n=1 Tax=Draconibacterium sp. IB214405 TaxID=3097352 RepID=UPI002A1628BD|nr:ABC transporter ATP-binding protein [Draconibacterium sp. IB214405]MDX8339088.1 ABC transporter ATP-binding protein [Draconibacterium sp. IB214405]
MRKTPDNKTNAKPRGGLFRVLGPYKLLVTSLTLMALAGSGINLFIPRIIARGIDSFTANEFDATTVITEFMIAAFGIFLFTFLQGVIQTLAAEKVAKDLRNKLADKISQQSYSFVLKANPSKLLTNMTSDMDSVKMFVSQAFVSIISSLFVIVGVAVLLISINWELALAVLTIVPILSVAFYIVFKKVKVLFKRSREVIDALNRVINESILGSALIRVLNSQQAEILKFAEKNVESRDLGLAIVRLFSALIPIVTFVASLAIVIILALGGHYVVIGSLSLGNFAAFNSYVVMLIFPVMMIGFMSNIIASATASHNRIMQVLDADPPKDRGTITSAIEGNIKLENIKLSYDKKPVLKDISLEIKAGSKTAIIGPTAAGKSQLLYLLTNLIPPESGKITIDNVEAKDYASEVLNRQVAFVFQDNVIFNLSLKENVAFNDKVSEEDMQKAIETAELLEFTNSLPDKLETIASERGTSLSGGQKQRIMLARALALNPKVLLLDDFTSRVDRKTEDKILANIHKNYPDLTLVSVTQKIAPVKNFDQIILLMEGEIVASGKHDYLKDHSPEYIQIYNSQKSTNHYEL